MGKSAYLTVVLACALSAYAVGCGGDDDDGGGGTTAGTGGSSTPSGGSGGSGGTVKDDPDPINPDCPQNDIGPLTGPYAPKGACCYRKSNTARVDEDAATRVLEYRLNYFLLINHQMTISREALGPTQIQRFDNEEQSLLFRFTLPQKEGKVASGDGKLKIGTGAYNCDGTYSFYSDKAAPAQGANMKPDRWAGAEIPTKVDSSKTDKDRVKAAFKDALASRNKESYTPYLGAAPDFAVDWEGESQGFDILEMPSSDATIDCVGKRQDMNNWSPAGKTVAFGRLDLNSVDVLDALNVNFCQLMSYGAIANSPKCDEGRCKPGEAGCLWKRLPDSLCPTTDEDKAKWGCHLGNDDNPDNQGLKSKCTNDVPATIDPDNGTPEGQCCDPLGKGTDGLPACNAWIQINEFVAAAADITDKLADGVQKSCHGK